MSTIHLSCILITLGWEYISRYVQPSTSFYVTLRGGRRLASFSITSLYLVTIYVQRIALVINPPATTKKFSYLT